MDALAPSMPQLTAPSAADRAPSPVSPTELTIVSLRHPSPETTALFTICLRDEDPVGA